MVLSIFVLSLSNASFNSTKTFLRLSTEVIPDLNPELRSPFSRSTVCANSEILSSEAYDLSIALSIFPFNDEYSVFTAASSVFACERRLSSSALAFSGTLPVFLMLSQILLILSIIACCFALALLRALIAFEQSTPRLSWILWKAEIRRLFNSIFVSFNFLTLFNLSATAFASPLTLANASSSEFEIFCICASPESTRSWIVEVSCCVVFCAACNVDFISPATTPAFVIALWILGNISWFVLMSSSIELSVAISRSIDSFALSISAFAFVSEVVSLSASFTLSPLSSSFVTLSTLAIVSAIVLTYVASTDSCIACTPLSVIFGAMAFFFSLT